MDNVQRSEQGESEKCNAHQHGLEDDEVHRLKAGSEREAIEKQERQDSETVERRWAAGDVSHHLRHHISLVLARVDLVRPQKYRQHQRDDEYYHVGRN